jgi:hypothetical protein
MNKLNMLMLAMAISFGYSAGSMAAGLSKDDYKAEKARIEATYKLEKHGCASLSGNSNDVCEVEAKGKERVAMADLIANYKPSRNTRYEARIAKAEADFAVAREKCDDMAGNTKDVCVKEAKAAQMTAKADARAHRDISDANATASDKSAEAGKDAEAKKRAAEYSVAKEKCDAFAGGAKDRCMDQAKTDFGKL